MRLLFFGTPQTAVPFLEACAREHEVVGVVTRPDRPMGRGLALTSSPVQKAAERLRLPTWRPENPTAIAGELAAAKADMAVVVAYGKILKPQVLAAARLGCMNVHFSLLPRHRGAAPIAWTLLLGDRASGVTLFWLDEGMDTGPVQLKREIGVGPDEDAVTLAEKLVTLGVEALREALRDVGAGRVRREPQSGQATLAPKLGRQDARIDFDRPAQELHDRVRALRVGPRAYLQLKDAVGVLRTRVERPDDVPGEPAAPGRILRVERERGVLIQCRPGRLWLLEVRPEGKKQISAVDFLNGLRLRPGDLLASR